MTRLIYTIANAIGVISVFCMVTDGFDWVYVFCLLVSAAITTMLPYELRRVDK